MESEHSARWDAEAAVHKADNVYTKGLEVNVKPGVFSKMFGWCKAADSEVSGLFLVKKEAQRFLIYDAFILPQECTSAATELDPQGIAKLMAELHKKKIPLSDLRGWWHTHYNFNCFWSSTDVATAEALCASGKDWGLAIVLNQKNEYICRLDIYQPVRVAFDHLTISEGNMISDEEMKRYRADVATNVRPWKYAGVHYGTSSAYSGGLPGIHRLPHERMDGSYGDTIYPEPSDDMAPWDWRSKQELEDLATNGKNAKHEKKHGVQMPRGLFREFLLFHPCGPKPGAGEWALDIRQNIWEPRDAIATEIFPAYIQEKRKELAEFIIQAKKDKKPLMITLAEYTKDGNINQMTMDRDGYVRMVGGDWWYVGSKGAHLKA